MSWCKYSTAVSNNPTVVQVVRVPTMNKINFVGSSLTECTHEDFFLQNKLIYYYCCSSYIDEIGEHQCGMLKPMRDKNEGTYQGGGGTTPVPSACPEKDR